MKKLLYTFPVFTAFLSLMLIYSYLLFTTDSQVSSENFKYPNAKRRTTKPKAKALFSKKDHRISTSQSTQVAVKQKSNKGAKEKFKTKNQKEEPFQETLVLEARKKANCKKPFGNATHVVCERLPFTEVKCGKGIHDPSRDSHGNKYLVPNIVHHVWIGGKYFMRKFHEFLAVRSVASLQRPTAIYFHHSCDEKDIVDSKLWRRLKKEIPCLKLIKANAPFDAYGNKMISNLSRSDFYRLLTIKEKGGIYMDLDVITAKSLDPLRIYPMTMGRSTKGKISNGIIIAEPKANFTEVWLAKYRHLVPRHFILMGTQMPFKIYTEEDHGRNIHVEKLSMNRPNPYIDGTDATTSANFDLSDNYFLHIHPSHCSKVGNVLAADEDRIRTMDNVYGAAGRLALFGSQDLVFLKGEKTHERKPTQRLNTYTV